MAACTNISNIDMKAGIPAQFKCESSAQFQQLFGVPHANCLTLKTPQALLGFLRQLCYICLSVLCPSSDSSGVKLFAYRQQLHGFVLFESYIQALSLGPIASSTPNTHQPPKLGSW